MAIPLALIYAAAQAANQARQANKSPTITFNQGQHVNSGGQNNTSANTSDIANEALKQWLEKYGMGSQDQNSWGGIPQQYWGGNIDYSQNGGKK